MIAASLWAFVAWGAFGQSIDMDAVTAAEQFRVGVRAVHRGHYHEAILSFEQSLSLKPENRRVLDWLALANYKAGYLPTALKIWQDLLETDYATDLLRSKVEFITIRRGVGKELLGPPVYVLSSEIDPRKEGEELLRRPIAVRARRDGSFYVVGFASNNIVLFDVNARVRDVLDGGLVGYDGPFDVLESDRGLIVTEFRGNALDWCSASGLKERTVEQVGAYALLGPQFLARDGNGYLYLSDAGNQRVHKLSADGEYVLSFGGPRGDFGGLEGPTGVALWQNRVYVAERDAHRISVFDTSGNHLYSFGEQWLRAPEGMMFTDFGRLLVADRTRLVGYDQEREVWSEVGDLSGEARYLSSVSGGANGEILVADVNAEKVFILSDRTDLLAGYEVRIERVRSDDFPHVLVEVSVTNSRRRAIVGLQQENFVLSEFSSPVQEMEMVRSPSDPGQIEVVAVMGAKGRAGESDRESSAVGAALGAVHDALGSAAGGRFHLRVTGGAEPHVVAARDAGKLDTMAAVMKEPAADQWRFDRNLRFAVGEVVGDWNTRAVIYVGSGVLREDDFDVYTLSELVAYLQHNHVSFWAVLNSTEPVAPELQYLCEQTGGKLYSLAAARGLKDLARDLIESRPPLYLFSYDSPSFSDFGRRYIEMSVEVVVQKKSGRDESGYFAPLTF